MADKEYAPWSRETSDGLITSAVDSHVRVSQDVIPALNVGTIDRLTGKWEGAQVSDSLFLVDATAEAVANGASFLFPQRSDHEYIDMTNFNDLFIAIKPSNGGNYAIQAVMGPDTYPYANLSPVAAARPLRGTTSTTPTAFVTALIDGAEDCQTDLWNILSIKTALANQKLLQFSITNNSGGPSNIQFASLRVV